MVPFIANKEIYERIKWIDKNMLLKYSSIDKNTWERMMNKDLDFVNTPTKVLPLTKEEMQKYPYSVSKIYLPFLKGYKNLFEEKYTKNFNTKEILVMLRQNIKLLKKLHDNNVYHGDLYVCNVMINKDLDMKYIDLDASIVDGIISEENIFKPDFDSEDAIEYTRSMDILETIKMYLLYLERGNFKQGVIETVDFYKLHLPEIIEKFFKMYYDNEPVKVEENYYFEDVIEELISTGYVSEKLETRNKKRRC